MTTPEQIYALFHKETNLVKGRAVKAVKNFDKARMKDSWKHFEYCAGFINRNAGHVDVELYIKALARHFEGWFDPNHLGSPKSIKIYREYVDELAKHSSKEEIRMSVLKSIKFVVEYCQDRGIRDIYEYMSEDMYLIPTVLKHLNAGSISMYFIAAVPNSRDVINAYPKDCRDDYIPNFNEEYPVYRMRVLATDSLDKVCSNMETIVEKMIQKE